MSHQDASRPEGTTDQNMLERFLQLPGLVALAGLWLVGVALISLFGLAFYVLIHVLLCPFTCWV